MSFSGEIKNVKGFTLMEILVYIVVLSLIIGTLSNLLIWVINANTKIEVMRETLNNARRAIEIITYETREAVGFYSPTSSSSQLSLETMKYLPVGETKTYIDFFLCGTRLCLKKENQDPIPLTSDRVEVSNLFFSQIATTSTIPSFQINLTVNYKNPNNRIEYRASTTLISTVSLRTY